MAEGWAEGRARWKEGGQGGKRASKIAEKRKEEPRSENETSGKQFIFTGLKNRSFECEVDLCSCFHVQVFFESVCGDSIMVACRFKFMDESL